jgi:uncharacterized protein YecT (DUF1311 family)
MVWGNGMRIPAISSMAVVISCGLAHAETQHWTATSTTSTAITGDIVTSDDRIAFAGGAELGLQSVGSDRPGIYRVDPPANPVLENGNRLCGDDAPTFIALAPGAGSASLAESSSLHLIVFQGAVAPPASAATSGMSGGGPGRCALLNYERKAGPPSGGAQAPLGRDAIRQAQEGLNWRSYDAGVADGVMGSRTRQALAVFQRDHGLAATGEPDEQTMAALIGSTEEAGPSFDCRKAGNSVERAICASPVLGRLDAELAASYRERIAGLSAASAERERKRQRLWIVERDHCGPVADCLAGSYSGRIAALRGSATR